MSAAEREADARRKALAAEHAAALRDSLGYIDIDRGNPEADWAEIIVAVLEILSSSAHSGGSASCWCEPSLDRTSEGYRFVRRHPQ